MELITRGASAFGVVLLSVLIGAWTPPTVTVLADFYLVQVVQTGELRGALVPLIAYENGTYRNAFSSPFDSGPSDAETVLAKTRDFVLYGDHAQELGTFHVDAVGAALIGGYQCTPATYGFGKVRLRRDPKLTEIHQVSSDFPRVSSDQNPKQIAVRLGAFTALSKVPSGPQPHPLLVSTQIPKGASAWLAQVAETGASDYVRTHPYVEDWMKQGFQEHGFPLGVSGTPALLWRIVTYRQSDGQLRAIAGFEVPLTRPSSVQRAWLNLVIVAALPPSDPPRTLMVLATPTGDYPFNDEYGLTGVFDLTGTGRGEIVFTHSRDEVEWREVFADSGPQVIKVGKSAVWGC